MTPSWTVSAWDESDLVPEPETTGMQWVWGRREPNFPVRFSCSPVGEGPLERALLYTSSCGSEFALGRVCQLQPVSLLEEEEGS